MSSRRRQIVRFLVAGTSIAVLDLVILTILTEVFGWWYLLSSVVAYVISLVTNFFLQKHWTFGDSQFAGLQRKIGLFVLNALLNLFLNSVLMYTLVDILSVWYILAQALVMAGLAIMNFMVYRLIIFKSPAQETNAEAPTNIHV